jgi:hypothetical protein
MAPLHKPKSLWSTEITGAAIVVATKLATQLDNVASRSFIAVLKHVRLVPSGVGVVPNIRNDPLYSGSVLNTKADNM